MAAARETGIAATVALDSEAATERLALRLARVAGPGDLIGLSGDLGSGKTTLARAFIRARAAMADRTVDEVPSPTFTLVQAYELPNGTIFHVDLFRIGGPAEAIELGLEDAFAEGICLVEWPERAAALLPDERLEVALDFGADENARIARLSAKGARWQDRLDALIAEKARA